MLAKIPRAMDDCLNQIMPRVLIIFISYSSHSIVNNQLRFSQTSKHHHMYVGR